MDHVAALSMHRPVIVATTHVSDADVGVVFNALSKTFDLGIGNQSTHHSWHEDWPMYLALRMMGRRRFFPVDFSGLEGRRVGVFVPANFEAMADAMRRHHLAMLVPAHSPCLTGALPRRGGLGAVYLRQVMEASVIVPAAAIVEYPSGGVQRGIAPVNLLRRPKTVRAVIGKAIELPTIPHVGDLPGLMRSRQRTAGETVLYRAIRRQLKEQSSDVMRALARLVPEEMRGGWR